MHVKKTAIFFLLNLILLLGSIGMAIYSAYYVIKLEDSIFKEKFFGRFEFVENVLVVDLVITLPIIIASILSFFGVMFKKGLILVMHIGLLLIAIVLQCVLDSVLYIKRGNNNGTQYAFNVSKLLVNVSDFAEIEKLQEENDCCGYNSYSDYNAEEPLPVSCCHKLSSKRDKVCDSEVASAKKGCVEVIDEKLALVIQMVFWSILVFVVIEVHSILFAAILIGKVERCKEQENTLPKKRTENSILATNVSTCDPVSSPPGSVSAPPGPVSSPTQNSINSFADLVNPTSDFASSPTGSVTSSKTKP